MSLSPIGCVPLQRTIGGGKERDCVESINQAATVYNSKLSSSIMALNKKLSEVRLVYLENYSEFNKLIQHHNQFGKFLHLYLALYSFCCVTIAKFHGMHYIAYIRS